MQKRSFRGALFGTVFVAALLAGLVAFVEQQQIRDWWRLRSYTPPAAVQALARDTTMNDTARTIFYVTHPKIESKTAFNGSCPNSDEKTIVLGCYRRAQQSIFVLGVSDARLQGVEQVTAAHEMLHAAYDRLSASDKKYVNGLLEDYYGHDLHDQRILDTIASYKKSEPNDVVNEMHSIFGTEVANLPAPLEKYYARYFTDRHKIAQYAVRYQQAFTSRKAAVEKYDAQLASLKRQITANEASLDTQFRQLTAAQAQLEAYRNERNYDAYNAGVAGYNAQVNAYNAQAEDTRNLIAQYNQIVKARNAIAAEESELVHAIDSTVQTLKQ